MKRNKNIQHLFDNKNGARVHIMILHVCRKPSMMSWKGSVGAISNEPNHSCGGLHAYRPCPTLVYTKHVLMRNTNGAKIKTVFFFLFVHASLAVYIYYVNIYVKSVRSSDGKQRHYCKHIGICLKKETNGVDKHLVYLPLVLVLRSHCS